MRKYLEIVLVAFAIAIPASAIAQSLLTTEATKVKITMLQNEYDREVKRCKDASILYEGFEVPALWAFPWVRLRLKVTSYESLRNPD